MVIAAVPFSFFGNSDNEQGAVWGLPNYSQVGRMCGNCKANRSNRPFTDSLDSAGWRPTEQMSNDEFVQHVDDFGPGSRHPLRDSKYFDRHFVRVDVMHVMDHNGVVGIVAGSFLLRLVRSDARLGARQEDRLNGINVFIEGFWERHVAGANPIRRLKMANLAYGGLVQWATLHGPMVKAANSRQLMPLIEELAEKVL